MSEEHLKITIKKAMAQFCEDGSDGQIAAKMFATLSQSQAGGPPVDWKGRHDDLLKHVKALGAAASILKKRHRYSSSCDFPNTCGGCHFWSGVIEACNDIVSGDKTTIKKASAIVKRDKFSAQQ